MGDRRATGASSMNASPYPELPNQFVSRRKRQIIVRLTDETWAQSYLWLDEHLPNAFRFYGRQTWKDVRKWLDEQPKDLWWVDFDHQHLGTVRFRSDTDAMNFKLTFSERLG